MKECLLRGKETPWNSYSKVNSLERNPLEQFDVGLFLEHARLGVLELATDFEHAELDRDVGIDSFGDGGHILGVNLIVEVEKGAPILLEQFRH